MNETISVAELDTGMVIEHPKTGVRATVVDYVRPVDYGPGVYVLAWPSDLSYMDTLVTDNDHSEEVTLA